MPMLRQRLKFPRTSILRMLSTVEVYGLVARKGNRWSVTERFHDWCSRAMHREIRDRYHESLCLIAREVDELVELAVGECEGVRYIDWIQAGHPVVIDPLKSSLYPLHRTASGKLLLSQRPDLCQNIRERHLLREIAEARESGVAWNRRESDVSVVAVATWVAEPSTITPLICVKWPFFRFTEAKARQALVVIRRTLARL